MAKTVVGLFNNKVDAESAVRELTSAGFPQSDIELIARNGIPTADRDVIANLTRVGVPGEEAREYTSRLATGKALVLVRASEAAAQRAVTVMERNAGIEMERENPGAISPTATAESAPGVPRRAGVTPPPATAAAAGTTQGTSQETRIPVVEEEMKVGKREVAGRSVHVFTHVVEEPVEREIALRQEHVNVERRQVDRPATEADLREFKEGAIEMTETAEEPVVSKEARVVEEVVVSKDATQENRSIRDTLRKTEVDVEEGTNARNRPAGAPLRRAEGAAPVPADENESTLARGDVARASEIEGVKAETNPAHFTPRANPSRDSSGGNAGVTPEHEYAFSFGEALASNPRHRGKTWEAVEPEAQREWTAQKKGAWEEFKEMIRNAWHGKSR
jgi:stress response protein YsnF